MNHPTLDRDVAEAIYKLLGHTYETEKSWCIAKDGDFGCYEPLDISSYEDEYLSNYKEVIPALDFSETIRILPKIGEKKEWSENGLWGTADDLARDYMLAPTPEQGMKEVSNYLRKIL